MSKIKTFKVTTGVYWVEIEEAQLYILCACPADTVKHLRKRGFIEEVETNGARYESGPNAILLSDVLMQNGSFSNLTEFPVLQMLYMQGMILPKHPNNTGIKPLLMGTEEQLNAQMEYIYRGNYGLVSKEEIMDSGISEAEAEEMMRIKLRFAFGKITPSHQLLDKLIIEQDFKEIRNGVFIRRKGFNLFEIKYQNELISVDLNLKAEECYEPSYQLGYHYIRREYFAVVHSGEGDGWDVNRPCMASVLVFQGKIYLIDAGPNILASLNYLGISVNEIEGIFHSHAHDDHFAGLTTLIRSDHRFKYYATKLVRTAVARKLGALMGIGEEHFSRFFDIYDLEFDQWTDIEGLEVMPVYSPHPIETNIFFFRARWEDGYKSYAHLADVVSSNVFSKMISSDVSTGISQEKFDRVIKSYLLPVNLKKIDVGGGLIHGEAEDFRDDRSGKLVLAHTSRELSLKQREVGSSADFGMVDVLIPAQRDYLVEFAADYLQFYFPSAPAHEINYLLNHPVVTYNAGTILGKKAQAADYVYLLLTGSVSFSDSRSGNRNIFSAGSLIGFFSGYLGQTSLETYWAASNITVLQLPVAVYNEFVSRNNLYSELRRMEENVILLGNTWLFGEVVSFPILIKIAKEMKQSSCSAGSRIKIYNDMPLHLIARGSAWLLNNQRHIEKLEQGDFFGGDTNLFGEHDVFEIIAEEDAVFYTLPENLAMDIPIVYWKLLETYEKRIRKA